MASATSKVVAPTAAIAGRRSTGVRTAFQKAVLALASAEAVHERDAALFDPVAELGEQRGQHRYRSEH
jgi:hypothetical protein